MAAGDARAVIGLLREEPGHSTSQLLAQAILLTLL